MGDEVLEIFPGFTDIVLEQALAAGAAGDADREEALLRRCLEMGDGPEPLLGDRGLRHLPRARGPRRRPAPSRRRRRGRGDAARAACSEHPGFLAAVDPYAALLLRRGVPAAEVVETVHALVADSSPSMRFLLAVALSEAGAVAEAEAELRAVVAAQPANAHARVALGRDAAGPGPLRRRGRRGRRGRPRGALCRRRRSAPSSSPC